MQDIVDQVLAQINAEPAADQPAAMSEDQLKSLIGQKLTSSHSWFGTGLMATDRMQADRYYRGDPRGDEKDGMSQVVSRDVMEVVDSLIPSMMRIFASGDKVVEFQPFMPDDEDKADQATDYINYIFMQQNEGFMIMHNWFKDSLLKRNGIIRAWFEKRVTRKKEQYTGLTQEQFAILQQDQNIEVREVNHYPDPSIPPMPPQIVMQPHPETGQPVPVDMTPQAPMLCDATVIHSKPEGKIRVENVAPDEFFIERRCSSLDNVSFLGQRKRMTVSDLVELGFDYEMVKKIPKGDQHEYMQERIERFRHEDQMPWRSDESLDESMRPVWITDTYLKVDYDGDGIAEWRQVILGGDSGLGGSIVLANQEIDDHPFCSLTAIPEPHKFYGLGFYDQVKDIQDIKTALWRGALDSIYLANQPMLGAVEGQANIDDLLDRRVGGVVRLKNPNGVVPLPTVNAAPQAFDMLEYVDSVREQRSGITRYNQGLDSDSLNKTATGINIIANAGKERQEIIARVWAETGVKRLFRRLFQLAAQHQDKTQVVKLRGKWVEVNPRDWADKMDVSCNVGIGLGNKDHQVMVTQQMLQMDEAIVKLQGGVNGPILTAKNVYNKLTKLCEAVGWKVPDPYYTDPDTVPPPQPQPDPAMMKAEADVQLKQMDMQIKQVDLQMKMIELEIEKVRAQVDVAQIMNPEPKEDAA